MAGGERRWRTWARTRRRGADGDGARGICAGLDGVLRRLSEDDAAGPRQMLYVGRGRACEDGFARCAAATRGALV